jgi:DNA-binding protein H-NS
MDSDRVLELETQLSGLRQQLQKQEEKLQEEEAAANDAITEWQNRCVELEGELQQAIQGKELTEQRLKLLENTQPQASQSEDPEQETKGNSPTDTSTYEERIGELEFALAAANDALSKHDEIVTQWEGKKYWHLASELHDIQHLTGTSPFLLQTESQLWKRPSNRYRPSCMSKRPRQTMQLLSGRTNTQRPKINVQD